MVGLNAFALHRGLSMRAVTGYFSLITIGLGSIAFHATLKRTTQLLDELPMLGSAVYFNWMLLSCIWPQRERYLTMAAIVFASLAYTLYWAAGFDAFVAMYGFAQSTVLIELVYLTRPRPTDTSQQLQQRQLARTLVIRGHALVITAVVPWVIDNTFCDQLRAIRSTAWLPVLFECHSLWHLLTGTGAHQIYTAAVMVDAERAVMPIRIEGYYGLAYKIYEDSGDVKL